MLDNLTFFDEMTGLVDKGQGVDIPHVDLSPLTQKGRVKGRHRLFSVVSG